MVINLKRVGEGRAVVLEPSTDLGDLPVGSRIKDWEDKESFVNYNNGILVDLIGKDSETGDIIFTPLSVDSSGHQIRLLVNGNRTIPHNHIDYQELNNRLLLYRGMK